MESEVSRHEKENGHHCQWVWVIARDEWSGLQAKRIEFPSQIGDLGDQRKLSEVYFGTKRKLSKVD